LKTVTNLNDPSLVRALAHPLRGRILGVLQERRASPSELSEELGAPIGNVAYHVRTLLNLKLIKLVKKTPRRGAIEHHYEAVSMAHITDSAWSRSPAVVKNAMVSSALEEVARSVSDGAATGGFDREEAHLTRTRLTLDERGWQQLSQELLKVLDKVDKIQAQSAQRLKKANHDGERDATLVMMLFEALSAPNAPPPAAKKSRRRVPAKRSRSRASSR
jgi:DNA-binding transcriptional ArsR family regulator